MREKEKNIIRRLSDTVSNLDKDKQNYLLGVAEGMAIAKDTQRIEEQLQEAQRGVNMDIPMSISYGRRRDDD